MAAHDVGDSRRSVMGILKHAPRGAKWRPKARDRAGSIAHCLYQARSRDKRALGPCLVGENRALAAVLPRGSNQRWEPGTEGQRRAMKWLSVTKRDE
jgi:hypothetical protein